MHLEGTYTFNTTQGKLWDLLNDPAILVRTTPGVESLEQTGSDTYQAVLQIKMGPINSAFNGTLQVTDKNEPESYRLLIEVDGKIGQIKAEGSVQLSGEGDETIVNVQSSSQLTGRLASMGQRLLSGVARMFTKQFFTALESELPN